MCIKKLVIMLYTEQKRKELLKEGQKLVTR